MTGIEPRPQRWEARVLPLCHRGPPLMHLVHVEILLLPLETIYMVNWLVIYMKQYIWLIG